MTQILDDFIRISPDSPAVALWHPLPVALSVSHRRAPLSVRERLTPSGEEKGAWIAQRLPDVVLLATCSRIEVYAVAPSVREGIARLRDLLLAQWGGTPDSLDPFLEAYVGEEAARHLFRVAAGLDSMVIGEAQILGQVGEAIKASRKAGVVGKEIERLLVHAVRAGRRVRAETAIGQNSTSIPGVAVDLARRIFGSLQGRRVLVVGAGEAGTLTARVLRGAGATSLFVTNRTFQRSLELAVTIGGTAIPFHSLSEALAEMDVVVSSTSAGTPIILSETLRGVLAQRNGDPLLLIDIAVPRDIEPAAASLPGVHLYNIDDLQALAQRNLHRRLGEVQRAESIVEGEVERLRSWWRTLPALRVLRQVHRSGEDLRQRAMARALRRMSHLTPEDRGTIEKMSRAILKGLLHDPILSLKEGAEDRAFLESVRRLFGLPPGEEDAPI